MFLADLLERELVDYLAIDLKTSPDRYAELHSGPVDRDALVTSIRLALTAPVTVEFRTTCVSGIVDAPALHTLGQLIRGAPRWRCSSTIPPRPSIPPGARSHLIPRKACRTGRHRPAVCPGSGGQGGCLICRFY